MKNIIHFLIILPLFLIGCVEKTDINSNYLTGTILKYTSESIDSIVCVNIELDSQLYPTGKYYRISKSLITEVGKFEVQLSTPIYFSPFLDSITQKELKSDSTWIVGTMKIYAYKNGNKIGELCKCNEQYYSNTTSYTSKLGETVSVFFYSNIETNIFGTLYKNGNKKPDLFDMNILKGWNEIFFAIKTDSIVRDNPAYQRHIELTNETTEKMDWRLISENR